MYIYIYVRARARVCFYTYVCIRKITPMFISHISKVNDSTQLMCNNNNTESNCDARTLRFGANTRSRSARRNFRET